MLRLIREEEPLRPSMRISASGQALARISAQRKMEPAELERLVRGELDWIVMKSLEKDRSRRYETATGLARDVERYLADELVEARPPTARYRLRKFARKNRVALTTAAAFAGLLVVAAAVSSWLAVEARRAEAVAEDKRIEAAANAIEAKQNMDAFFAASVESTTGRIDAELRSLGLQVDLDLAELRTDPRVGLLRLAHPMKDTVGPVITVTPGGQKMETSVHLGQFPEYERLREFVTAAVLATGQNSAPLLPPITHDGENILNSFLNAKGDRLLTRGADKTARLWNPFTGRQIAILRRADEKVIEAGLSPDGATAFTQSPDGVIRLWSTKDGAFVVQTEPRPDRVQYFVDGVRVPFKETEYDFRRDVTQLSNDRLLTKGAVWTANNENSGDWKASGPVELWDAKTGRFIARLGLQEVGLTYAFFGDGRWIGRLDSFPRKHIPYVFSAENGQLIAKLKLDEKYVSTSFVPNLNPSGRTAATISRTSGNGANVFEFYVHFWDTTSWHLLSTTGPFNTLGIDPTEFRWIADDRFAITYRGFDSTGPTGIFRPATATPIAELPGSMNRSLADRVVIDSGQLFDTRTWRRLQPPKGRKYHPEITRFAPDGRFVPVQDGVGEEFQFIDSMTEKTAFMGSGVPLFYQERLGWVGGWVSSNNNGSQFAWLRLPPPDRLNIPPDLLDLWAQVAVRGQLDEQDAFVKWDEPTWEKKRQELAAKPAPLPDFPFPGYVARDRLHWLRSEYENAHDQDKPRLAKQLLDRAEVVGDKTETVRWRAIVTPKSSPTKPAASKQP